MRSIFQTTVKALILITFLSLGACAGFNNVYVLEEEPHFTLDDVFYQKWVAGVKDGGSGTNLHFTATTYSGDVRFMHAYFRLQKQAINQNEATPDVYVVNFMNEELKDRIMDADPNEEAANIPDEFPFELKDNEAVLSYLMDGELKFYKVGPIAEKPMLAYPGTGGEGPN